MRKLLLASAAIMGASVGMASHAFAQSKATNDTIGDSVVTLDTSGQSATNDTSGDSFPTPGTVTVRLNGRFRWYVGSITQGAGRTSNFGPTPGVSNGVNNTNVGQNKLSNYGMMEYARLYPGFDGVAANGLKYGASLEIRAESNHPAGGSFGGSNSTSVQGSGELYWRRQFGYLGTDRLGTLRVGSSDGVSSLFLTGNFENFDGGGWDGDIPDMLPSTLAVTWPFTDAGGGYVTNKIVYLSPQFYGFDFGLGWEPTTGAGANSGCGASGFTGSIVAAGSGVASPGCDNLSSSNTNFYGDLSRRKNTFEIALRYRGVFGPIGVNDVINATHSGRIANTSNGTVQGFQDLNYIQVGSTTTWNGITVGGNWKYGNYDATDVLSPSGSRPSTAWIVGASYAIGPLIVGASYIDYIHPNGHVPTATIGSMREQGIAAGATYSLAPGVSLVASYLWGQRKQNGVNILQNGFVNGVLNPSTANNKVNSQVFAVGTNFAW